MSADGRDMGGWRAAFQSSPADYQPLPQEARQRITELFKLAPDALDVMDPKPPVTGTLRYRFAVSATGTKVRVRLSNEEGHVPLLVLSASIGLAADGIAAKPGSLTRLTFGGRSTTSIPAGAPALSDPVALVTTPGTELLVSVYTKDAVQLKPNGGAIIEVAAGDQTLRYTLDASASAIGRPLVSEVEVLAANAPHVIVALGDSTTDGTRQHLGELRGWPEELEHRLASRKTGDPYAVVNAGISGNRVLSPGWGASALSRLDRDVLRLEGVSHLIVLEGTNDIGLSGQSIFGDNPIVTPGDLIAGYRQIIARAHARGIEVLLGTIMPFGASPMYFSPEHERLREDVNLWIRTSKEADAVIDFDKVARDPASPNAMRKDFGSSDGLHPGEAGYKAMGDAFDLALFP